MRHSLTDLVPVAPSAIYEDPFTHRFYNSNGEWVDRLGRLMPHRGPKGKYSSKGKHAPNYNPGGRCANPPHVHGRFGEFARDSAPASSSVSQGPPPQPSQRRLEDADSLHVHIQRVHHQTPIGEEPTVRIGEVAAGVGGAVAAAVTGTATIDG